MSWSTTVILLLLSVASANAQIAATGAGNSNSPLVLNDNITPPQTPVTSTTGRTLVAPTVGAGTLVLIYNGQSIGMNTLPTAHTPTNTTKVLQINAYDQNVYQAKDPLLTADNAGGSYLTYLADKLVTDGKFSQVIIVPFGWSGTGMFDWAIGLLGQRARVACLSVRSKGWIGSGAKFGIIYDQGQGDDGLTSTAQWEAWFQIYHQNMTALGCNFDMFVPVHDTWLHGAVDTNIQAAQAGVIDNVTVFTGADTDSLTGANRQADGTHLTDAGGSANANLWATILEAHY